MPNTADYETHRTTLALNHEWSRIVRSARARLALARWIAREPELRDVVDLDELAGSPSETLTSPRLVALARLAPDEPVAARVLLQILLPRLAELARIMRPGDPVVLDELASLTWIRIRTSSVVADSAGHDILHDVRLAYRRHRAIEVRRYGAVRLYDNDVPTDAGVSPDASSVTVAFGRAIFTAVRAAYVDRLISSEEFRLIMRTRLHGESLKDVAADDNVSLSMVERRLRRAELLLRTRLAGVQDARGHDLAA